MSSMSASEARASLPDILDRVGRGDEVTITRHGRPVAVVVSPSALRTRRAEVALADAERIRQVLAVGRDAPLPDHGGLTADRADELAAGVRTDRDARP